MNGAVGEEQRQCDIIGDALRAHVVEEGKAPCLWIVETKTHLMLIGVEDRERAGLELGCIRQVEGCGVDDDLAAQMPDETAAEHIGVERLHKGTDAPER